LILGGDGANHAVADDAAFRQPGVQVLEHREDAIELLRASALSVNPLTGIRGSAIKLIESLLAGRICVSTREGARGFVSESFPALAVVDDVAAMAGPVVELLRNAALRREREAPRVEVLSRFSWERCAAEQGALYRELLAHP
jgi:glycosyltransferase involved in cell wall biosynthesis